MEHIYAGFWKRLFAYFLDNLILALAIHSIALMIFGYLYYTGQPHTQNYMSMHYSAGPIAKGVMVVMSFLYYTLMESSRYQATLGKLALGIKVTDASLQRVSFLKALGRNVAKLLNILTLGIGYLMIAFTKRKQGLHDMLVGCLVVCSCAKSCQAKAAVEDAD